MRFLGNYLYYRRRIIIVILTVCAVFALFMMLYGLPLHAVFYAGAICAVITAAAAFGDFHRYWQKFRILRGLQNGILLTLEHLPECDNEIDECYHTLLELLHEEKRTLNTNSDRRYNDAVMYFTMWAHQIKTPISAMSLLLQGMDTDESRELSGELLKIEQYVEMALCYIHMDGENSDYVLKKHPLDKIIRAAVRRFSPQFIRQHIKLVYEQTDYEVLTDEKWLLFVVEQIISNALKYTKQGSVTIAVLADNMLSVRDTGIGIPADDLPRIFERGYTGNNGRGTFNGPKTGAQASTGIGLYLCKRICRELGHEITVQSDNTGTEVLIRLTPADVDTRD